jgi:chromosome condensin MukBEF ATPase and DNA-binding subunit MukB
MKQDIESTQRLQAQNHSSPDGDNSSAQERYFRLEQQYMNLERIKEELEDNLKIQSQEMQKFQFEYEDQVSIWKKEKSDL